MVLENISQTWCVKRCIEVTGSLGNTLNIFNPHVGSHSLQNVTDKDFNKKTEIYC